MTDRQAVNQALATIGDGLRGLQGPGGAALRDQYGLQSTKDRDQALLAQSNASSRTSEIIGARLQFRRMLDRTATSDLADLLAQGSALTGEAPTSREVCHSLASHLTGVDPADLPALLRAFGGAQPPDWADWSAYDVWNEALAEEFFGGSRAGRPVYLDLEPEVLDRLAATIGAPASLATPDSTQAFVGSVARTLALLPSGPSLLEGHVRVTADWIAPTALGGGGRHALDTKPPPFVAALGLFSLAAELMRSGEGMLQTNYYGRLCELLEVDDDPGKRKVQGGFRQHAHRLWAQLNAWLQRAHGTRGIPTAAAFDYRVHIGIPISQALVRAADRDRLPEFFSAYRLNPGQQFSRIDMREVLAGWLPGSSLTGALKSLWASSEEARRRIADVVCIELEHWDGTHPVEDSGSRRQLQGVLVAGYEEIPIPEFSMMLAVRDDGQVPVGRYRFTDGATAGQAPGVVQATRESRGLVRLTADTPPPSGDWLPRLALRGSVQLAHESSEATISRPQRSLVVLLMDEAREWFVESARVELGREHFLLVRNDLAAAVTKALEKIARPGCRALTATAGVPDGWTLYEGVHMRALLPDAHEQLRALVPLSTTQVDLTGGMQLSAGRWHSSAPPDVIALDALGRRFAISLFDESGTGGEFTEASLDTYLGEAQVSLGDRALADGNYRIVLNEVTPAGNVGAHLTSRGLRLRSAESAHLDPPADVLLGHEAPTSLSGWTVLSATSVEVAAETAVRGASISGGADRLLPVPPMMLPAQLSGSASIGDVDSLFRLLPAADRASLEAEFESILRRGLVVVADGKPRLTRAGLAWANKHLGSSARTGARAAGTAADEIDDRFEADLDLILDALIVTGGGGWHSLDQLIRYSSVERWEPLEAARNLSALGYIDLELDHRSLRPRRWSTAPPTVVVRPDGLSAFIAGARSERLLQEVEKEVRHLGGSTFRHPRSGRPVLLQVHALPDGAYETLAARAGLACVRDVPQRIAQMLPSIHDVYRQRPEFYVPRDASLERFDFEANKWRAVDKTDLAGAYLITADTRHYAVLAEEGLRECDNSVAKYVAAAATGRSIMSYNASDETLTCLLGARPPGIYERALVLCTGELPRSLSNGTSVYEGVTPEVAAWLGSTLGPNAWIE